MEVFTSYALASSAFRSSSRSRIVNTDSGGSLMTSEFVMRICQIGNRELKSKKQWTVAENKLIKCDFRSYFTCALSWEFHEFAEASELAQVLCSVYRDSSTGCLDDALSSQPVWEKRSVVRSDLFDLFVCSPELLSEINQIWFILNADGLNFGCCQPTTPPSVNEAPVECTKCCKKFKPWG
jgi:hypothetical protein